MNRKVYICTGGCGAEISEEQYKAGLTKCGAEGCSHKGKPFEERVINSDASTLSEGQSQ